MARRLVLLLFLAAAFSPPSLVGQGMESLPEDGRQILAVFISASFCPCNELPGWKEDVHAALGALERVSSDRGRSFATIGVSLDHDPVEGSAFLAEFGPFDEMMAGSNWWGTGAILYIWRDYDGEGKLPMMVVIEREVEVDERVHVVRVTRGHEIVRALGVEQIRELPGAITNLIR